MDDTFLDFVSKVGVMKPAVIDEDNTSHKDKLNSILMSKDYAAEEKIDGCHYMCFGSRFFSTEGCEKTHNYPHLKDFFEALRFVNLIIDGEINYPGKTSQYCTRATGAGSSTAISFQEHNGYVHYTIWDILRTPKGTWIVNKTYDERRQILEQFYERCIKNTSMEQYIHLVERRVDNKKQFYEDIINSGKEGIVLKKLDSFYIMGKKPMWQWMKMKQQDTADFFIMGYDEPKIIYTGKNVEDWPYWDTVDGELAPVTKYYHNNWIGALQLGAYVNGVRTQVCTTSGFSEELREQFSKNKEMFINKVVKVTFMEKTEANYPRHPRFEAFHESKTAKECTWELLGQEE